MSDNKNYQKEIKAQVRGVSSSREDKSGAASKRVRTSDAGAKESRGFSSSKYDKRSST